MHLILTGATGSVGGPVLRYCLASPNVTRLSILSRREFTLPVGDDLDTQKAEIIVHNDYATYPSTLINQLKGANGYVPVSLQTLQRYRLPLKSHLGAGSQSDRGIEGVSCMAFHTPCL